MNTKAPLIITLIGFILLVYMIVVEDEPGALPLGLMTMGLVWYFFIRRKRSKRLE